MGADLILGVMKSADAATPHLFDLVACFVPNLMGFFDAIFFKMTSQRDDIAFKGIKIMLYVVKLVNIVSGFSHGINLLCSVVNFSPRTANKTAALIVPKP